MAKYKLYKSIKKEKIKSLTSYFFYYYDHRWDDESYLRIKQGLPVYPD